MKGQITACGFVTQLVFAVVAVLAVVKGQITACGFVTSDKDVIRFLRDCKGERPDYRLRFCYIGSTSAVSR